MSSKTLFVGNLCLSITHEKLKKIFTQIGPCKIDLKGQYAFIEYKSISEAKKALLKYHKTNLEGINKKNLAKIEYSNKNLHFSESSDDELNYDDNKERKRKRSFIKENNQSVNRCKICNLEGHFARNCILSKEKCYECGETGHLAKECTKNVRNAPELTYDRVKAVLSQQSFYKLCNPQNMMNNIIKFINSK